MSEPKLLYEKQVKSNLGNFRLVQVWLHTDGRVSTTIDLLLPGESVQVVAPEPGKRGSQP